MKCPFCSSESTRVLDSRPTEDNTSIRRRRECEDCGGRFTTYGGTKDSLVIKKDGRREIQREKIMNGLLRACEKRPISLERLSSIVDSIEDEVTRSGRYGFSHRNRDDNG